MRRVVIAFTLLIATTPLLAQDANFGFLLGGSRPIGGAGGDGFSFGSSVKEIYYSTPLDPVTRFKVKVGQIGRDGDDVEHAGALIEYRFDEPFGSAGLFAGGGYYRQSAGGEAENSFGLSGGVNGDFPLSRNLGVVVEVAYHWINFDTRPRFLTLTGGLRYSF